MGLDYRANFIQSKIEKKDGSIRSTVLCSRSAADEDDYAGSSAGEVWSPIRALPISLTSYHYRESRITSLSK